MVRVKRRGCEDRSRHEVGMERLQAKEDFKPRKAPLASGKDEGKNPPLHKNQFEMDHRPKCKM